MRWKFPCVGIALFFMCGIMAGRYVYSPETRFPIFVIVAILLFLCLPYKNTTVRKLLYGLLPVIAGLLRFQLNTCVFSPDDLALFSGKQIDGFHGMISECYYRADDRDRYVCLVDSVISADSSMAKLGKVIFSVHKSKIKLTYGRTLWVKEKLTRPTAARNPGQFDYRTYLWSQDIFWMAGPVNADSLQLGRSDRGNYVTRMIINPVRDYFYRSFQTYLDGPSRALMQALILGEKQDVDPRIRENFQKVGVVHVLAISGLHVGFIIAFVFAFLTLIRMPPRSGIWILSVVLFIYIVLVNFKAPVMRASLMAILFLIGQLLERKTSVYNLLFAAAFIILMFEPRELFNPGFQFSFLAVGSIIYGYERLDKLIPISKRPVGSGPVGRILKVFKKTVWVPFLVSLAAVLGTLPLTLYYYGFIPVYAVIANLVVIPLVGLIVFLGLFLLVAAAMFTFIPTGIGQMIGVLHDLLIRLIDLFSSLPNVSVITAYPSVMQIILMSLIILLLLNLDKHRRVYFAGVLILTGVLFFSAKQPPLSGDLQVDFLDVGQGDAAFIRFPNGRNMLIDCGDASPAWDQGERTIIPFLQSKGILHLNYLVASHAHNDHIGGAISLLENLRIDTLVMNGYAYRSRLFQRLCRKSAEKGVAVKIVARGDQLRVDRSCRVYILHPDSLHIRAETFSGAECNNSSVVLKIQYGANGIIFMGDLEMEAEQPLLSYGEFLESELIKVGHHGSKTSTSADLLGLTRPLVAIVSVARKNKFKHPSVKTLDRLAAFGTMYHLSSGEGCVSFSISPDKIIKRGWR